jgi:hypothetical protein
MRNQKRKRHLKKHTVRDLKSLLARLQAELLASHEMRTIERIYGYEGVMVLLCIVQTLCVDGCEQHDDLLRYWLHARLSTPTDTIDEIINDAVTLHLLRRVTVDNETHIMPCNATLDIFAYSRVAQLIDFSA